MRSDAEARSLDGSFEARPLRVALFPDTFYEPNGVATLSRQFALHAQTHNLPLMVVRSGEQSRFLSQGTVDVLELKRGPATFRLDKGLYCDPALVRHKALVTEHLAAFRPDLVHITGPGDLGFLGLWVAHLLRVPLVASWHTNLHEYLSRRLERGLRLVPGKLRRKTIKALERQALRGLLRFYQTARFTLAPNQELNALLSTHTKRPSLPMAHGVDLDSYSPRARESNRTDCFCIGYVGRLTTEKNVRALVTLDCELRSLGETGYRFLIVGDGGQQHWLRKQLPNAEFRGVLRGEALADAYRQMDAFLFPSQTDTFGLVTLEAMASGVPVVLRPEAGRNIGIEDGVTGCMTERFADSICRLLRNRDSCRKIGAAAREFACRNSWDSVFRSLYSRYSEGLAIADERRAERERARTASIRAETL